MKSALVIVLLLFIWPFSSGKLYHMKGSNSVPAASGTVKAKKNNDNGNTRLNIKVHNLAKPSSLNPSENVYVVWIRTNDGTTQKKGAIRLNNNLDGQLKVATVSKSFDVLVTGEQSTSVTEPTGPEVLQAHVDMD